MMLYKKQIQLIFLFELKMGGKTVKTTSSTNNTFANEHTVRWWFKKFCKGDNSLEDKERSGWSLEADNNQFESNHQS